VFNRLASYSQKSESISHHSHHGDRLSPFPIPMVGSVVLVVTQDPHLVWGDCWSVVNCNHMLSDTALQTAARLNPTDPPFVFTERAHRHLFVARP